MPKAMEFDKATCEQIVALRDGEGYKWGEISNAMATPTGKCMLMYLWYTVKPKDKVKNATAADIVRLRDKESVSWGEIAARVSYPESAVRSMYTEATGKDSVGLRIGKGGRHPGSGTGAAPTKKAAAKKTAATSKKAAAAAAAPKGSPLDGLDKGAVIEALTRHAIKTNGGEVIKVKAVKSVTKNAVVVTDETGAARTVKRAEVAQVSAKPVMRAA